MYKKPPKFRNFTHKSYISSYYVLQKQQKGKEQRLKKPGFEKDNLQTDYFVTLEN